jgi:hypothetical protein
MRRLLPLGLLALALLAAGCRGGAKKYKVTGKVHRGGQVMKYDKLLGSVQVEFVPLDGKAENASTALADPVTGEFNVPGSDGKGLPAGKYRISVRYLPEGRAKGDLLEGQFGRDNSPIQREVTGPSNFDIDLDKPN